MGLSCRFNLTQITFTAMRCLLTSLTLLFLTLYVGSICGKPKLSLIQTKDAAMDYKDYKDYFSGDYKDYNKDYKDYKGHRSADYRFGHCVCVRSPCPCSSPGNPWG